MFMFLCPLKQGFANSNMHMIHPGVLLKCRFEFCRSKSLPSNKLLGATGDKACLWTPCWNAQHLVQWTAVTQKHWEEIMGDGCF